jgi:hypothetical protein
METQYMMEIEESHYDQLTASLDAIKKENSKLKELANELVQGLDFFVRITSRETNLQVAYRDSIAHYKGFLELYKKRMGGK